MVTANEKYFDSQIRHAVGVRRYTAGQIKQIIAEIEAVDSETAEKIRQNLLSATRTGGAEAAVFLALLSEIFLSRRKAIVNSFTRFRSEMYRFAETEIQFERRLVSAAVSAELKLSTVEARKISNAITLQPFEGALFNQWVSSLVLSDRNRVERTITRGVASGMSIDDILRSVVGTRRAGYSDGILSTTRSQAEALIRTTTTHVFNSARELFYLANQRYFSFLRWESILDAKTSAICRSRDGALTPIGVNALPLGSRALYPPDARPPAHFNCRSIMVAFLDNQSSLFGGTDRQSEIGPVPRQVTYNEWLRRQPRAFQEEVLGKTRAALFRKGGLTMNSFVDRRGNELTLNQLRRTNPEAFEKASI